MLSISPEKVCYVIIKAREFDVKVDPVEPNPGSNPSDEAMDVVLEDYADDPVYEEIKEFINSLNEDEQINLVALAWIGRETFDADEWNEAFAEARRNHNDHTAEYLLGMPRLGDYLEEGLSQMGYSCDEYDLDHL